MPVYVRYEPNNLEFGQLMMSHQTTALAMEAARRGVIIAQSIASQLGLPAEYVSAFKADEGPVRTYGRNPRRTARVVNDSRLAGPLEFGSGHKGRSRKNKARSRPQGGYSRPYRVLGKTLPRIGNPPIDRSV